jgi:large subunit ribosomal protein L13
LATFSRVWYLFDAKWQCPHLSGEKIARILRGEHKPIYYPGGTLNSIIKSVKIINIYL